MTGAIYDFKDGTSSEEFYLKFEKGGDYYIVIDSNKGFSELPYTLYMGKTWVIETIDWKSTDLTFTFKDTGFAEKQLLDLSTDDSIPDEAYVKEFHLSNDGNGGKWRGFEKYLMTNDGRLFSQTGPLEMMPISEDEKIAVKQKWWIFGNVSNCSFFVWKPKFYVMYVFPATTKTLKFIDYKR